MTKTTRKFEALEASSPCHDDLRDRLTRSCHILMSVIEELGDPAPKPNRSREEVVHVYWAGCGGLARVAGDLPDLEGYLRPERELATLRVDKIGSTSLALENRLQLLGRDEYGAWSYDAWGQPRKAAGFRSWMAVAIHTTRSATDEAVTVGTRSIDVQLPLGLSRRNFESCLHEALSKWSLSRHYADLKRYTSYGFGDSSSAQAITPAGGSRMSEATELYVGLDPRRDGDCLLALVENILADHRVKDGADRPRSAFRPELPFALLPDTKEQALHRNRRKMSPAQITAMQTRLRCRTKHNKS